MIKKDSKKAFVAMITAIALVLCAPFKADAQGFNAFKDPVAKSSGGGVSGPNLAPVTETVPGGKITIGTTSYVVVMFRNDGTSPVKVTGRNLYPSSGVTAVVTADKCSEAPLTPEAECALTVAVTPQQLGPWRIEVLLDHDGRTRLTTAAITGDADGQANKEDEKIKTDIEATPDVIDFGSATGSIPQVKSAILRNRTQEPVTLKSIKLQAPERSGYQIKPECPEILQPGETCAITVIWTPVLKGETQAVISTSHSAKSALTSIEVKGSFEPSQTEMASTYPDSAPDRGLLISDMDKIEFGDGIKGVAAITTTLVNMGTADVELRSIRLAGSDNGLSIARVGCKTGMVLKPVDACALTINWVPSRAGDVIDDLQITHSGARGILVLPIRGSADEAVSRESLAVRQAVSYQDATSGETSAPPQNDTSSAGTTGGVPLPPAKHAPKSSGGASSSDASIRDIVDSAAFEAEDDAGSVPVTPVLDGYKVTSHSSSRAVVNGPVGSFVVRDGEDVVVSGVTWKVTIVSTGVVLSNRRDQILLVFDKSLRPAGTSTSSTSSSSSSSSSSTSSTSTGAVSTSSSTSQ